MKVGGFFRALGVAAAAAGLRVYTAYVLRNSADGTTLVQSAPGDDILGYFWLSPMTSVTWLEDAMYKKRYSVLQEGLPDLSWRERIPHDARCRAPLPNKGRNALSLENTIFQVLSEWWFTAEYHEMFVWKYRHVLLISLVDALIGMNFYLAALWSKSHFPDSQGSMKHMSSVLTPSGVMKVYLFNPLSIYSAICGSYQAVILLSYSICLSVAAYRFMKAKNLSVVEHTLTTLLSCAAFVFSAIQSPTPLITCSLAFPIVHSLARHSGGTDGAKTGWQDVAVYLMKRYVPVVGLMAATAWVMTHIIGVEGPEPSLVHHMQGRPNLGMWWYLMTQSFERYKGVFWFVLNTHLFIYTVPLFFRLCARPVDFLIAHIVLVIHFQQFPGVGDYAFLLPLLLLRWKAVLSMEPFGVAVLTMGYCMCACPMMMNMWLTYSTGNANYVYFQGMVFNFVGHIVISEWTRGLLWAAAEDGEKSLSRIVNSSKDDATMSVDKFETIEKKKNK